MIVADHSRSVIAALTGLCMLAVIASCFLGVIPLEPSRIVAAAFGAGDRQASIIIWEIRMPRAIAALCVGMALGASGAALQGLLRNPLAEPGVLGVSAMASLFLRPSLSIGAWLRFQPGCCRAPPLPVHCWPRRYWFSSPHVSVR